MVGGRQVWGVPIVPWPRFAANLLHPPQRPGMQRLRANPRPRTASWIRPQAFGARQAASLLALLGQFGCSPRCQIPGDAGPTADRCPESCPGAQCRTTVDQPPPRPDHECVRCPQLPFHLRIQGPSQPIITRIRLPRPILSTSIHSTIHPSSIHMQLGLRSFSAGK